MPRGWWPLTALIEHVWLLLLSPGPGLKAASSDLGLGHLHQRPHCVCCLLGERFMGFLVLRLQLGTHGREGTLFRVSYPRCSGSGQRGWVSSMWLLLDTWHPPAFSARGPFQEMDTKEGFSPQDSHPQKGKENPQNPKKVGSWLQRSVKKTLHHY